MQKGLFNAASILALATLSVVSASAQVVNAPDSSLTKGFVTDNSDPGVNSPNYVRGTRVTNPGNSLGGFNQGGYVNANGLGIGYDPNNTNFAFGLATSPAMAQTFFQPFVDDTTNILPGTFQVGVHGDAINSNLPTQTAYVSIFQYNPTAANGTAPIGNTVITNVPVVFNVTPQEDNLFFSSDVTLTNPLLGGQEYVLVVAPSATAGATGSNLANFIEVDTISNNRTNLDASSQAVSSTVFQTNTDNANQGGAGLPSNSSPIAYELYAQNVTPFAPTPEPGQFETFGVVGLVLASLMAYKRRRA